MSEKIVIANQPILSRILNTYETNMAGWLLNRSDKEEDQSHTSDIDNSRFKNDFSVIWQEIRKAIDGYLQEIQNGNVQENTVRDLAMVMLTVLQEKELYDGSEKTTPISKTAISYNSDEIINKINQVFDAIGAYKYKVDTQAGKKAKQYEITIRSLMENALYGENKVTIQDFIDAEKARLDEKERRDGGIRNE